MISSPSTISTSSSLLNSCFSECYYSLLRYGTLLLISPQFSPNKKKPSRFIAMHQSKWRHFITCLL
ncbi:hypothetical protein CW304_22610 [Bacillus sp. UFRGS-B20]|nr:hypothetical protein CW304_22610 [Bacillus sp. UFRGS-B20]